MALKPLTIETLGKLDYGSAELAINAELAKAVADLDDRATGDNKPRKVVIEILMTPIDRSEEFDTEIKVQAKLPCKRTAATRCKAGRHNKQMALYFQENAPGDPNQRTIDEMEDAQEGE